MNYTIVIDPHINEYEFELSPYNLKKDIKGMTTGKQKSIATSITYELMNGPGRPSYSICYRCQNDIRIHYAKIRISDSDSNKGKTGGYRIISLIDDDIKYCFVLHIYKHAHGEDNDISKSDKNLLEKLVEEYYKCKSNYGK